MVQENIATMVALETSVPVRAMIVSNNHFVTSVAMASTWRLMESIAGLLAASLAREVNILVLPDLRRGQTARPALRGPNQLQGRH